MTDRQQDVSPLLIPANPPIDEERREALRRDPRVKFYERPDPDHCWSYEPTLAVIEPIDVRELIDGPDDDTDEQFDS